MFVCLYACVGSSNFKGGEISFSPFPSILAAKFLQISSFSNHTLSREALKRGLYIHSNCYLKNVMACVSNELPHRAFKEDNRTPESQQKKCSRDNSETVWRKVWTLTIVAATIRAGEAEWKLTPRCPAGPGARTHWQGYDQRAKNGLASKCGFGGAVPQTPLIQDV